MNELNHNHGKGDKDRSPGWRANYEDIDFDRWHHPDNEAANGFARRGNRLVKTYTPGRRAIFRVDQVPVSLACGGRCNHPEIADCRCVTRNGGGSLSCSLPIGHGGEHIACGVNSHRVFAWADTDDIYMERLKEFWPPGRKAAAVSADMLERGIKL